jgi:hypothetical protein
VDVPAASGAEQRLYLEGDSKVYHRGGVINELRDPFLQVNPRLSPEAAAATSQSCVTGRRHVARINSFKALRSINIHPVTPKAHAARGSRSACPIGSQHSGTAESCSLQLAV